ncbi:DUF2911 domain-containing protein [Lacihabitans sp. LS3-19]|uniref:DUF2911 domain-containing protein n=1 Tax=Lacihabitans sp. LS3-19 TaxID=2487335 RepID=UPI0020CD5654|nr:DUF2911 domain-containing protein [Lacihabitans sp. LS3-19]MCP9769574.1 DUF2911 domain-containing protein [Lacihabitans sp. LS3-19]
MKKNLFLLFTLISTFAFAQKPAQSPAMTTESDNVKVTYGQPSKRDREIFGKLVPYNEIWRTGANAATEVTFKKDVNFGGAKVKAGTYTLFTIPNQNEWSVILNSELKQWGAYGYDKIKDKNIATIKVRPMNGEGTMEKLIITATDAQISIEWDNTVVRIPLTW